MSDTSFITRVTLWNYRSIRSCSVALGPLTFLVGPNGAGKSNFLDALRLVSDSLRANLRQAVELRGGVREMSFRPGGAGKPDAGFGIRLEYALPLNISGWYAVRIGVRANESAVVEREECHCSAGGSGDQAWYAVSGGQAVKGSEKVMPVVADDQLYLLRASSIPSFRPVYDALSRMAFYNLNPDAMRGLQPAGSGENLNRDGANLSAVFDLLAVEAPDAKRRILEFLTCLAPGIDDVIVQRFDAAKKAMLTFKRTASASRAAAEFASESMSDGELRALGVLTALFQSWLKGAGHVPLVGIEEPESALHPRAASALRDALISGSASTQVVVTTHSPEILDDKDISPDWILGVSNEDGTTRIAPIGEADRSVLRDKLFTAGELLRKSQLCPASEDRNAARDVRFDLFGRMGTEGSADRSKGHTGIVAESRASYAMASERVTGERLTAILREYKAGLKAVLGDTLDRVLLYGSCARGEATQHSDIDVLCVMRGPFDLFAVLEETSELTSSLCLKHDVALSRQFTTTEDLSSRMLPFHMNVRREAVPI